MLDVFWIAGVDDGSSQDVKGEGLTEQLVLAAVVCEKVAIAGTPGEVQQPVNAKEEGRLSDFLWRFATVSGLPIYVHSFAEGFCYETQSVQTEHSIERSREKGRHEMRQPVLLQSRLGVIRSGGNHVYGVVRRPGTADNELQ